MQQDRYRLDPGSVFCLPKKARMLNVQSTRGKLAFREVSPRAVHTRFTSCALDDEFQELSTSGFASTSTATISRYGDLVSRITLEIVLPPLSAPDIPDTSSGAGAGAHYADTAAYYVNSIDFAAWEDVILEIGGSTVDQLFSDFCFIYEELAGRAGMRLEEAIGRVPFSADVDEDLAEKSAREQTLYVPLPLWFSKYQPATWGLALPIVALSFHEIKLKLKTRSIAECVSVVYKDSAGDWRLSDLAPINATTGTALVNSDMKLRLLVSFVYLDVTERNAMSSVAHSFLINVTQRQVMAVAAGSFSKIENKLFFNHPCSSLLWYMRPQDWNLEGGRRRFSCGYKDRFDFSHQEQGTVDATKGLAWGDTVDPITTASRSLNGHQRWPQDQNAVYFRVLTPYTSWRTMPTTNIYTYSFALQAQDWQPTAHLNMSRLKKTGLKNGLTFAAGIKASELIAMVESYNLLINDCQQQQGAESQGSADDE
ncbi:FirrV-1-B50 [Tribonema minus]|uniref:FirrV-1-B50 n=1 Tax=Tribonema minus TaxID=303371 RepID=A0A835ZCT3_9STRA|nr:FirrV-1-B50 [Tribonema minus]